MRIVSLTCSNTEIVCALGMQDSLVGVDDHSDYPPDVVDRLPRVGPDLGIFIDQVMALEPDLVLASLTVPGHEDVIAGLDQAGLTYMAPEPVSVDDVYRDIFDIAAAMGVAERADNIIESLRTTMRPANATDAPDILVQWWPKPVIAPGRDSWVNDQLRAAGAINPLADRPVKSTPLEDADVAALDPAAIVIAWCGVKPEKYRPEVVYRNPAFSTMQAVINERVFCVPEAWLGRPSPRLADGVAALSDIVRQLDAG